MKTFVKRLERLEEKTTPADWHPSGLSFEALREIIHRFFIAYLFSMPDQEAFLERVREYPDKETDLEAWNAAYRSSDDAKFIELWGAGDSPDDKIRRALARDLIIGVFDLPAALALFDQAERDPEIAIALDHPRGDDFFALMNKLRPVSEDVFDEMARYHDNF